MKVKMFEENKIGTLEEVVNDFLSTLKKEQCGDNDEAHKDCGLNVEIKYQTMWVVNPQSSSWEDNCAVYSAMIIYHQ